MKCDKWPIVIDGRSYLVDRTFGGDPAIYIGNRKMGGYRHIESMTSDGKKDFTNPVILTDEDVVIIVARLAEVEAQP